MTQKGQIAWLSILSVVALGGISLQVLHHQRLETLARELRQGRQAASSRQNSPVTEMDAVFSVSGLPRKGSLAASIGIVEFSDFECPYCSVFARDTLPTLEREYIATGRVAFVFRHLPLEGIHKEAAALAKASVCAAEQGQFWPFHDDLFARYVSSDTAELAQSAQRVGLKLGEFQRCFQATRSQQRVTEDIAAAKELGLSSTPSFLVGHLAGNQLRVKRRVSGARTIETFRNAIDQVVKDLPSKELTR